MNGHAAGPFGVVSLVQVQPNGLIIDNPEPGPAMHFYDASRRVEVDRLQISDRGIEALLESGERVLDIHHLDHPGKEYVEYPGEVWPEDLGESLTIENQDTGEIAVLKSVSSAEPCIEFSRFCLQRPQGHLPAARLSKALRFLGGGRRGFLLLMDRAHGSITVRRGDRVFLHGSRMSREQHEAR